MSDAIVHIDNESLENAFEPYSHFTKVFLDAFVLINTEQKVIKCSQLFSQLTGLKTRKILKSNHFSELIRLYVAGDELTCADILEFSQPDRIDEVKGKIGDKDKELNLILGVYPFRSQKTQKVLGTLLLIRDVTAENLLQSEYNDKNLKSITDPLTGLFTRSYFEEYLPQEIENMKKRPEEHRFQMTLIMCDIDFFKKINDTYGHQAGDLVLQETAQIMKNTFRKTDTCCRYGGEEFLVILPTANLQNSSYAANQLRKAIAEHEFKFNDQTIPVTISCGLATIDLDNETYQQTMARADQSLYQSKHNGRNRTCGHDGENVIDLSDTNYEQQPQKPPQGDS